MKIRVSFTVNVSDEDLPILVEYAENLGYGYDNPNRRTLLQRLFKNNGASVIVQARESLEEDEA